MSALVGEFCGIPIDEFGIQLEDPSAEILHERHQVWIENFFGNLFRVEQNPSSIPLFEFSGRGSFPTENRSHLNAHRDLFRDLRRIASFECRTVFWFQFDRDFRQIFFRQIFF
ncbi:hypothetical protein [Roseibium sp. RKSG952]|uniref:hypothetical protein n=1 Tax=Roseibium sp. RKSG952 TaxID=2529384 RepID=UPI0012BC1780|nr:hypothetical protein [Roseibium sp. RKSG952]MTH96631.1 hypothetical protein [Roseibium sp. RKSG952]